MKPRSTVTALLAITEALIAARAKAARTRQGNSKPARTSKLAKLLDESRPLLLPIKPQAIS